MKRRLLASIMTLVMMLSLLPTAVWAANTGDESATQETGDNAEPTPQSGEEETPRETATSRELDLDDGSIVISATGYTQGGVETKYTGDYTIMQTSKKSTTNTITVTGGDHTITLNGVNIDVSGVSEGVPCAFAIESGEVTLVLADESENTLKSGWINEDNADTGISYAGLWVQEQAQVVINGNTGKLAAVGGGSGSSELGNTSLAAGIGASRAHASNKNNPWKSNVGTITIEGGVITATGSAAGTYGGAGIGGGGNNSDITITGGNVTANSGKTTTSGCAGIGSAYSQGGIKTITISGGTVNATGGSAGIGGGAYQGAGVILIDGGTVTAKSNGVGAGIGGGGGAWGSDAMGSNGSVTITGGTVNATGSRYGAGIGGGGANTQASNNAGAQASGNITISGGIVTATGGQYAPGIGSGAVLNPNGKTAHALSGQMGSIVISGGSVTATNGNDFVAEGGKSYKTLDDGGVANVNTGIGQGVNASEDSQTAFVDWTLKDGNGETIIEVEEFNSNSATYTRNGGKKVTVEGADGKTVLYLPEGYYDFNGTKELIATAENKGKADEVKEALNNIDTPDVEAIRAAEKKYNALSASLRYYVDATVAAGHTLENLKESLKGQTQVKVSFDLNYTGAPNKSEQDVTYYAEADLGIPERTNYVFTGWYLGDRQITDGTGKTANYPLLTDERLTAHWESEVKGTGTVDDPYIIVNGSNMVALSHITLGIGTKDDYNVFGGASWTSLLAASYRLEKDITLSTEEGFYGIGGYVYPDVASWRNVFCGTFDGMDSDGNVHTITLNIDTTKCSSEVGSGDDNNTPLGHVILSDDGIKQTHVEVTGGIFNYVSNCTIKNLITTGSVKLATKAGYCGVVVGSISNASNNFGGTNKSVFENCTNNADAEVGAIFNVSAIGGIFGNASGGTVIVTNCKNTGKIVAGKALTLKSGNTTLSQGNSLAGGICSIVGAAATFTDCTNTGEIVADRATELGQRSSRAAGICGQANNKNVTFTNCVNTGDIKSEAQSTNAAAGIVGTTISTLPMTNCTSSGTVYAKDGRAGAIFGAYSPVGSLPEGAILKGCYQIVTAGAENTGWKLSDNSASVTGEELKVPVTSEETNFFSAERYVVDGDGTKAADLFNADGSKLYNDLTHNENLVEDAYPFQTADDAYVISNAQQYMNLVKAIQGDEAAQTAVLGRRLSGADATSKAVALATAYVKIAKDFTLSDVDAIGLGTEAIPFSGTIDGQSHTVTLNVNAEALTKKQTTLIGIVGDSAGATVKDLNVKGSVSIITDANNDKPIYIGSIVASGSGVTIENCNSTVAITAESKCTVNQATMGMIYAGGLIGSQSAGAVVKDSTHKGNVTVTAPKNPTAGGIAGSYVGTMENVTALGDVTANEKYIDVAKFGENSYAGGIAGSMSGTLKNVTAAGIITATNDSTLSDTRYAYAGGLVGSSGSDLTVDGGKALTTVKTVVRGAKTVSRSGAMLGYGTAAVSGDSWYVKTADIAEVSGATPIDTTVLNGKTFGDTTTMAVPTGVTMSSDYASLTGSTVSFIKAGNGTVNLVYDGQTFFTTDVAVDTKKLSEKDVTITGINSAYPSDDDAAAAKANISVIYGDKKLVEGTDYTVKQESNKFVINFIGNYTGSAEKSYTVEAGTLVVTAKDYTGIYDGEAHSIIVNAPEGATVEYGTEKTSYSTTNVKEKNAGTYVVYWKVSKEGSETVTGSAVISIVKAPLTIKADNQSMYVGGKLPTFTYTATGLVKGETLVTEPTLTYTADGTTVGKFDIVPSGADAGNNYKITYVNGTLTVSRRHSSSSTTPEPTPDDSTSFVDVPANAYFADAVEWAVNKGITNGLSDTMFGPYESCTRAQIVTFLWRAAGSPEPASTSTFADVPASAYYAKAVAWAVENGITNGMTETAFAPNATCTRGQSVTFLYRALKGTASGSTNFTDVKPDAFYADAVDWAVASDVTNGTSATTFSPNTDCTRAEIVTFLYRAYQGK
ncbi:S-layer homology domain-containing protein [Hominicoprocola fusiformis]